MATGIIILILLVMAGLGIRKMVRALQGKDRCACIGDCSKCKIQCQTSEKYYGVQREPPIRRKDQSHAFLQEHTSKDQHAD